MMQPNEAYDLISYSAQLLERLTHARETLARNSHLDQERDWLDAAIARVRDARAGVDEVVENAVMLPELAQAREDYARRLQEQWVDAVERLLAGITFHTSSRDPIIEAWFPKQKLDSIRRARRPVAEQYAADFEKRREGSYVKRMLAHQTFAFALPVLEEIDRIRAKWLATSPDAVPVADETLLASLRASIVQAAEQLEQPIAQARLLAEAALLPIEGAFAAAGLNAKPRRRAASKSSPAAGNELLASEETVASSVEEQPEPRAERQTGHGM